MMRFRLLLLLGLLLTLLPAAASAQTDYFVYLYNDTDKQLVRVNLDGTQQTYSVGDLGESTFISGNDMAFTTDGSRVAFCGVNVPPGTADAPGQPTATFFVRDITAESNITVVDLGQAIGCRTTADGFSEDEGRVAVGVVNHFGPDDPNAANTDKPIWQLLVIDVTSGNIVAELNADMPVTEEAGMLSGTALIPEVRSFSGSEIVFAEVPWGIGGVPNVVAYRWNIDSGMLSIEPNGPANFFGADELHSTDEVAWTDSDPNRPAAEPAGPVGFSNVVRYVESLGADARVIYHNPDWTLLNVRFIDSGRSLAVLLYPAFDPNQDIGEQTTKWVEIGRGGVASDLQTDLQYSDIANAPDGYVFLELTYPDDNFETPQFSLTYHTDSETPTLWNASGAFWEIAWATPVEAPADLTPFPATG